MVNVLFVLKRREDFNSVIHNKIGLTTGLYNSANFMNEMLVNNGVDSNIEVVIDNNDIDRVVTLHRPTHVIIEALWVVPPKFSELRKVHPNVKWIIRLHSEMPFMAGEGIAMDWLGDYSNMPNLVIACNAPRMTNEISMYLKHRNGWADEQTSEKIIYLPNYYPQNYVIKSPNFDKDTINISCFGAIRPLKNHLLQAFSAIDFANNHGKKLRFHVNAGRIEMKGEPVVNNLRGLFQQIAEHGHQMVDHQWMPREEFLELCRTMDIGMQVSFSETFNIVAADLISQGVPVVGSSEIPWMIERACANPVNSSDIVSKLNIVWNDPVSNVIGNQTALTSYTNHTIKVWLEYFY
jgi:hypothetical protein